MKQTTKPKVLVIGGGFGGLAAVRALKDAPVEITLLDKTNHHLFQPLLYQVATAALSPADIATPLRSLLRNQKNATTLMAEVTRIDPQNKTVQTVDNQTYSYDYLILACGGRHSYFGNDQWEAFAPGLKTLEDALEVRGRFLEAFEQAEKATDADLQKAYLTIVIVGGGPTGVEMAGVIPEIVHKALQPDYRRAMLGKTRVILIENSPHPLNSFPPVLAQRAQQDLERLGVEVRTGERVMNINVDGVTLQSGEAIAAKTVFWAAGNQASPLGSFLDTPRDRGGHVQVSSDLSVPNHPEIFVIGDMAAMTMPPSALSKVTTDTPADHTPKFVPGVAQGAVQSGTHAAKMVLCKIASQPTSPFVYKDLGNMAVIGRGLAVADMGEHRRFSGLIAWWLWLLIHLVKLVGFRNRAAVLFQWGYAYITFQRVARLLFPHSHK